MPTYNAWHGGFGMFFSPHKILTAKNKIDAPKKNQGTTCWLLNGFTSHKMFNLHKCKDYTSEENTWQKMVPCVFFFSLTCKPHVFHWDPMFSTRPHVFHQTPCFPHRIFYHILCFPHPGAQYKVPHFPPTHFKRLLESIEYSPRNTLGRGGIPLTDLNILQIDAVGTHSP